MKKSLLALQGALCICHRSRRRLRYLKYEHVSLKKACLRAEIEQLEPLVTCYSFNFCQLKLDDN